MRKESECAKTRSRYSSVNNPTMAVSRLNLHAKGYADLVREFSGVDFGTVHTLAILYYFLKSGMQVSSRSLS